MFLPDSEKAIPAFSRGVIVLSLAMLPGLAAAGPGEDFQVGLAAYQAGDVVGAMAALRRAADAGHGPAQALYGDILDKAELNEEAVRYLRLAADQGNADGQYGLAVMLLAGEGVAKNPAEAGRWLQAAAVQNHPLAINALAQACIDGAAGCGSEPRPPIRRAAESGYLPAMEALAKAYRSGQFGIVVNPAEADAWAARVAKARGERARPARSKP